MKPASLLATLHTLRKSHGRAPGSTLTPAQLHARWGGAYSIGTLANWRAGNSDKRGPASVRVAGRVLYPIEYVENYEQKLLANAGGTK